MTNDEFTELLASACQSCLNPGQISSITAELLNRINGGVTQLNSGVNINGTVPVAGRVIIEDSVTGNPAKVADGHLSTLSVPFMFEVAHEGLYGDAQARLFNIIGRRAGFNSTSVLQDVGEWLGTTIDLFPELTGVEALELISSSVQDDATPGGTGTHSVKITYLDAANNMVTSAPINLNGTSAVAVPFTAKFIYWMEAFSGGASEVSVGNIDLRTVLGSVIQERITAGGNKSMSARFMIPTGYHGFVFQWATGSIGGATQDVRLRATTETVSRNTGSRYLFQDNVFVNVNVRSENILAFMEFKPLAKIKVSTISSAGGAANRIDCSFPILLIEQLT